MQQLLSLTALVAIWLAAWLLPKYLVSRVTNAARGAVDQQVGKAIAAYTHELDKRLEDHRSALVLSLESARQQAALQRERFARDYTLFASRRNEVYAETYSLLEKARGAFSTHFAPISQHQSFERASAVDLASFLANTEFLTEGEKLELKELSGQADLTAARRLADVLWGRGVLRRALGRFSDFRVAWVLYALYYSREVDALLKEAIGQFAVLDTLAEELLADRKVTYQERKPPFEELGRITIRIRDSMREEMQSGFESGQPGDNAAEA